MQFFVMYCGGGQEIMPYKHTPKKKYWKEGVGGWWD